MVNQLLLRLTIVATSDNNCRRPTITADETIDRSICTSGFRIRGQPKHSSLILIGWSTLCKDVTIGPIIATLKPQELQSGMSFGGRGICPPEFSTDKTYYRKMV